MMTKLYIKIMYDTGPYQGTVFGLRQDFMINITYSSLQACFIDKLNCRCDQNGYHRRYVGPLELLFSKFKNAFFTTQQ